MMSQSSPEANIRGYFCSYSPQLINFTSIVALISAFKRSLIFANTSSLSAGRSPIKYITSVTSSEISGPASSVPDASSVSVWASAVSSPSDWLSVCVSAGAPVSFSLPESPEPQAPSTVVSMTSASNNDKTFPFFLNITFSSFIFLKVSMFSYSFAAYPFTAPIVTPFTKYFCKNG